MFIYKNRRDGENIQMSKTINLDEKLECKGYWWLPNNPNETVAGVLTYIPD